MAKVYIAISLSINLNVIQFKVIAFLSSNAAGFVTGANVPVDSAHASIMAGPDVYNE